MNQTEIEAIKQELKEQMQAIEEKIQAMIDHGAEEDEIENYRDRLAELRGEYNDLKDKTEREQEEAVNVLRNKMNSLFKQMRAVAGYKV